MSTASPPERANERRATALGRELSELLIELSIGVHRYAMYPPDHPALVPVAENIITRLAEYFESRDRLAIGVARDQMVIGGVATDSKHPVLSDLARRLHDHQLGALSFRKGVRAWEVEELLEELATETDDVDATLGARIGGHAPDAGDRPGWENISVHPIGYGKLEMAGDDEEASNVGDRAVELWLGLAQAAVLSDEEVEPGEIPDERVVAESIRSHREDRGYDQVIAGYLLQLAEELKGSSSGEASRIRTRVSSLIQELDESTLDRLVAMGGDAARRRKLVLDANQTLAVDAVMKMVKAAASTSEQTISSSMVRMLNKLSQHAEDGPGRVRSQADTALRDNVEKLVSQWDLEDPNPEEYTLILDVLARAEPGGDGAETPKEGHPRVGDGAGGNGEDGALRMVQMALEVEAWGLIVQSAVAELMKEGRVAELFDLMGQAPESVTNGRIRKYITSPGQVRSLLGGDDVDEAALDAIVEEMGREAVAPLMDALVESESRAVRRKVFDRLTELEEDLHTEIRRRLQDSRWYVVRNMLALIQRLDTPPSEVDYGGFLDHPDQRVRREAFPLVLQYPASRTRTLATGLADEDERLNRMALVELRDGTPETLVPTLVNRIIRSDRPEDLRSMAVRALEGTGSGLARTALLELVRAGKTLFRREKLAEPSPTVLAALKVLARDWSDDPEVARVLEAARASGDAEMARAAAGGGAPEA
ncbi:MAG: hypothetical protein R3223_05420 [Longimicrobiales bacterium]|nr:hypothetical protein [Longimicrobiales bacterium]